MKRSFQVLICLAFAGFALSACETVAGAGKDLQKAGNVIERSAQ